MRGGKSDAGGPEKQLILFVWPYQEARFSIVQVRKEKSKLHMFP